MIEKICDECSKPFETIDDEATMCPECWQKAIDMEGEGKGEDKEEK